MDRPLSIAIDRNDPEAAYHQIASQIRRHIADGRLGAGTLLPGVRGLAADLGVNMNTVARAYRVLEEQGFVRIRGRSGVEVIAPLRKPDRELRASLEEELSALLIRMRQAGVTPGQLRSLVNREIDALGGTSREGED